MDVMHLPMAHKLRYILVIVDLFTRWPEAFALQTVNGLAVANALNKVQKRHGFVDQILCDNASYNVGNEVKAYCEQHGIKLSPVSEYHPEANGIAESKVKALKDLLRALATSYKDWPNYLDTALFAYRTSYNRTVKDSPFFLNHGRDAKFPNAVNPTLWYDTSSPDSFNALLDEDMKQVFKLVKKNLEERQKKLFVESDTLPNYFEVGQSVLFYNPIVPEGQHASFHSFWQGPYTVIQKLSPVVFRIQRDDDPNDIRRAHVARLKRRFLRRTKPKAFFPNNTEPLV
jgi:transposase